MLESQAGVTQSCTVFQRIRKLKMAAGVWFWVVGWMLTILRVLGNGLLIYLITSRKRLHSTVNWFLLSLGLADLCVGLTQPRSQSSSAKIDVTSPVNLIGNSA